MRRRLSTITGVGNDADSLASPTPLPLGASSTGPAAGSRRGSFAQPPRRPSDEARLHAVCVELVTTEEKYSADLANLCDAFSSDLREAPGRTCWRRACTESAARWEATSNLNPYPNPKPDPNPNPNPKPDPNPNCDPNPDPDPNPGPNPYPNLDPDQVGGTPQVVHAARAATPRDGCQDDRAARAQPGAEVSPPLTTYYSPLTTHYPLLTAHY